MFLNGQQAWEGDGDYGGGDLVLYGLANGADTEGQHVSLPGSLGTMIAFPAGTVHEVMPVTWGERYAVVGWFH